MKRLELFLIGGVFYICLILLWSRQFSILVKAEEIRNGYLSSLEEDQDNIDLVLSDNETDMETLNDTIQNIQDFADSDSDYENTDDVSEDTQTNEEDMNNEDQFRIMIIFCFGLVAGVIIGNYLTGFIK